MAMRSAIFLMAAATVGLAACGDRAGDPAPRDQGPAAASTASGDDAPAADSGAAGATDGGTGGEKTEIANELFEFSFEIPAEAAAIPALAAALRAELETQAREARRDAAASDFPYHAYAYDKSWERVADLPDWLSLSATIYTFSGGAHGMTVFDSLVWDKRADAPLDPIAMFVDKAALNAAIKQPFCAELDRQRAEKRGEPIASGVGEFNKCLDPADSTIILGSSNGRKFDRIGVLITPYDAGPYAEGAYEVTLPVTDAVIAAIKPRFRPAFSSARRPRAS